MPSTKIVCFFTVCARFVLLIVVVGEPPVRGGGGSAVPCNAANNLNSLSPELAVVDQLKDEYKV